MVFWDGAEGQLRTGFYIYKMKSCPFIDYRTRRGLRGTNLPVVIGRSSPSPGPRAAWMLGSGTITRTIAAAVKCTSQSLW